MGGLQKLSGGIGDTNAKDGARRSYLPSCPAAEHHLRPPAVIKGTRPVTPEELASIVRDHSDTAPAPKSEYALTVNETDLKGLEQSRTENRNRDLGLIAAGCSFVDSYARTGDPGGEVNLSMTSYRDGVAV